jgi:hypothetical protein
VGNYSETAITIDYYGDEGKARIDSCHNPTKFKLAKLGAKEVTDQPRGSTYKSFEVPADWIHIKPPKKLSEKERVRLKEMGFKRTVVAEKNDQEGAS